MYGTPPRMGFFVPIFVDVFVRSSTGWAKPHNHNHNHNPQRKEYPCPTAHPPNQISIHPDNFRNRFRKPPKGTIMHVVQFRHRLQAERIASYLADNLGDTVEPRTGDSSLMRTVRSHLVGFYAYTQGFSDAERRVFSLYVRELTISYLGGDCNE